MRQTNGEPYMYIDDGDIVIRPLTAHDYPLLLQWLTDPRVLAFYGGRDLHYTPQTLKEHYEEPFDGEGFRVILEYRDTPIGYGQIYAICGDMFDEYHYPMTDRTVYAMDQFIGEVDHWNHGIGTRYCKMICTFLKEENTPMRSFSIPTKPTSVPSAPIKTQAFPSSENCPGMNGLKVPSLTVF